MSGLTIRRSERRIEIAVPQIRSPQVQDDVGSGNQAGGHPQGCHRPVHYRRKVSIERIASLQQSSYLLNRISRARSVPLPT
jgi:hypothetical protein